MKAYSLDFRQKIIHVYENEPISQRQLAKRFCVALSFIQKLLKQYRTTGVIAAKPFAGGVKLKLNSEQLVILAELISANNDATLEELVYRWCATGARTSFKKKQESALAGQLWGG